ncbi:MAG: SHOCT domain-containing protein [Acidimicrobiia bacterium]|nr:SHOCT domain-containing protein [Acidimicrobiia bacterium]
MDSGPQLFSALIVANAACGFVFFYFWAYMYWDKLRKDAGQQLETLRDLHHQGAISDEELDERRQAVLDSI